VALSGENLFLALGITLIASIILGTGLPTVPSYLLLAIIVAPSLVKLGLPLLAAHFFIFYYGVTSDLSPRRRWPLSRRRALRKPIPGRPPGWSAASACRFSSSLLFVYSPSLLLIGPWSETWAPSSLPSLAV